MEKEERHCDSSSSSSACGGEKIATFEEIYDRTTHYGRYQLFVLVVIQYCMLNAAGNYIFIGFASLKPACTAPPRPEWSDVCTQIAECPVNNSYSQFYSLYEEGNIVCPYSELPQHLQSLQAVGSAVGALLGGLLADHFGRKWVAYSGAVQMALWGIASAFAPSWLVLAAAMLGMGFAYGILVDSSMTLASETVGSKYRIVQTLAFQWSLAIQIGALCAYLTADWRRYMLAINGLSLPVLLLIPLWAESPRWLIQKKRFAEAALHLNTISAWNHTREFSPDELKHIRVEEKEQCNSLYSLISTRRLFSYSVVMFFSALTVETTVAVFLFDVQTLAGNPFLNIALYGILRMWVPLFIIFMEAHAKWFGRRLLFIGSQAFTMVCFMGIILIPSTASYSLEIRSVLALLAGIVNSSIFFTVYKQYSIELYPTLMRATAVGAFGVIERVGGALAPQLIALNHVLWPRLATTAAAGLIIASLFFGALILPETRNEAMPDTTDDAIAMRSLNSASSESPIP